jgi:hypothetical protein
MRVTPRRDEQHGRSGPLRTESLLVDLHDAGGLDEACKLVPPGEDPASRCPAGMPGVDPAVTPLRRRAMIGGAATVGLKPLATRGPQRACIRSGEQLAALVGDDGPATKSVQRTGHPRRGAHRSAVVLTDRSAAGSGSCVGSGGSARGSGSSSGGAARGSGSTTTVTDFPWTAAHRIPGAGVGTSRCVGKPTALHRGGAAALTPRPRLGSPGAPCGVGAIGGSTSFRRSVPPRLRHPPAAVAALTTR